MRNVLLFALSLGLVIALNVWFASLDRAHAQADQKYEECVLSQYGMTVMQYYYRAGHYPTCK